MINVVGLGYIGLPTALMLAAYGNEVIGTDYNKGLVARLNKGEATFEEEGLQHLFDDAVSKGLSFSNDYQVSDYYIVSVPTPYDRVSKKIDPSYVVNAVAAVLGVCPDNATIVIESTISPGTIDKFIRPLMGDRAINLAHAPERIIPGNMIKELSQNARTIGADSPEVAEKVKNIYATFCKGTINLTDIRSAEMSKVVENTFRDINIAYANELSRICHEAGLDVYEIIRLANTHPRVNILNPGPGVGGHCISVDPWFLVGDFPETVNVIRAAREVNDEQPRFILQRVRELQESIPVSDPSKIGFYGITYKANVDDTRESPMLQMFDMMGTKRDYIRVYDPHVNRDIFKNQFHDFDKFLDGLELLVVMVGHDEIIENQSRLAGMAVFDTCHVLHGDNIITL